MKVLTAQLEMNFRGRLAWLRTIRKEICSSSRVSGNNNLLLRAGVAPESFRGGSENKAFDRATFFIFLDRPSEFLAKHFL
jgi:hypothetical protein